jgi:hypothetical protein
MAPSKRAAATRATQRKTKQPTSPAASKAKQGHQFVCPECGRTFSRAAALGAHRSRAHGVAGQSAHAKRSRQARQASAAAAGRSTTRKRSARSATASRRGRAPAQTTDGNGTVDRDALLTTIFPEGMPAREDVIRAASNWLDEAERLARTR